MRIKQMRTFGATMCFAMLPVVFINGCGCPWHGNIDDGMGMELLDMIAPAVVSIDPANAAEEVELGATITATFSEAIDSSTITAASFTVTGPDGSTIAGVRTIDAANLLVTFTPTGSLALDTEYRVTISTDVTDLVGNELASDFEWSFSTGTSVPIVDTLAPTVSSTVPLNGATGVAVNQGITAVFSEIVNESTLTAGFTVTGPGAIVVAGAVEFNPASNTATFTPENDLALNTLYTATITTAVEDVAGNALESDFVWTFMTGLTVDTTAPIVIATNPANGSTGVPINTKITATFSEPMDPATISTASFRLVGPGATAVTGSVAYAAIGSTATFTPATNLALDSTYTATLTTAVRDLAGNALISNEVWTFTTAATLPSTDIIPPTVVSINPSNGATNVPINQSVNATFSEPMDPATISTANYTLTGPGGISVIGTVSYDVNSRIATFAPQADLAANTSFTVRITTGVEDLAGNALASDFVWSFTTSAAPSGEQPVILRSLSTFAAVAGAGLTNSNSAGVTTINGDVGLSPTATCLGDGSPCSAVNPLINGTLYANDPGGIAAAAKADLTLAYTDAAGRPPGTTVNDLTGMVLAPGVYSSGSTMSIAVGGTLTLDAQGNANGVWIFQVGSSLTVNNSAQVLLVNGAKASNVYWAIFASSTMGTNVSFKGNVLAGASNSLGTGTVVEGRMLCRDGQITLLSNTITLPAP